jgi:hypothetical protein
VGGGIYSFHPIADSTLAPPTDGTLYTAVDYSQNMSLFYVAMIYGRAGGTTANLKLSVDLDGHNVNSIAICSNATLYYVYVDPLSDSLKFTTTVTPFGASFPVYAKLGRVQFGYSKGGLDDPQTLECTVRYSTA